MITVSLTAVQMDRCKVWGAQRTNENLGGRDISDYRAERFNLSSLQQNKLAMCVEYALYIYQGFDPDNIDTEVWAPFVPKSEYSKHLGRPDIAGLFEARRANVWGNALPVRTKDVKAEALVVQGYVDYDQPKRHGPVTKVSNQIVLTGWVNAREDWDKGYIPSWSDGDARSFAFDELRPMNTLDRMDGVVW